MKLTEAVQQAMDHVDNTRTLLELAGANRRHRDLAATVYNVLVDLSGDPRDSEYLKAFEVQVAYLDGGIEAMYQMMGNPPESGPWVDLAYALSQLAVHLTYAEADGEDSE